MLRACLKSWRPWLLLGLLLPAFPRLAPAAILQTNDIIAFAGGSTTVALEENADLETLLTLAHPRERLKFRSLAWEGDTVFARPRQVNFPTLSQLLDRTGATMLFIEFGAMESLTGKAGLTAFVDAYGRLVDDVAKSGRRIFLVTPFPFEPKAEPLPDLSARNADLGQYAAAIRDLAATRKLGLVDVFAAFERHSPASSWTSDGRTLSPSGSREVAIAWIRELGFPELAERARRPAFWQREEVTQLRAAITKKNQLWFDYWRPTNWAFLHGDRTEQPSSRDHLNPRHRWFPIEMENFVPLIAEAEVRVESLAAQLESGQ